MATIAPKVFADIKTLGHTFGLQLLDLIAEARASRQPFLLGCPSGRSPRPVYQAMGQQLAASPQDLSHVTIVMMDDYVAWTSSGFIPVPADKHFSCRHFANEEIVAVLNAGLPPSFGIPPARVWFPDPRDPISYDARIEAAGGINLFILACGASDGHIAFNPRSSGRDSRTRIVKLSEETRRDNMKTFPDFRSIDEVPGFGVTVGIDTIASQSKAAVMLVWGGNKRLALNRLINAAGYDPYWPASIVAECRNASILTDTSAAGTS